MNQKNCQPVILHVCVMSKKSACYELKMYVPGNASIPWREHCPSFNTPQAHRICSIVWRSLWHVQLGLSNLISELANARQREKKADLDDKSMKDPPSFCLTLANNTPVTNGTDASSSSPRCTWKMLNRES